MANNEYWNAFNFHLVSNHFVNSKALHLCLVITSYLSIDSCYFLYSHLISWVMTKTKGIMYLNRQF